MKLDEYKTKSIKSDKEDYVNLFESHVSNVTIGTLSFNSLMISFLLLLSSLSIQ